MYQVQYYCKGEWVNWGRAPTPAIARQYESVLRNRYVTRVFKIGSNS